MSNDFVNKICSYLEPGTFVRIGKGPHKGRIGIVLPRDHSFDYMVHLRLTKSWCFVCVLGAEENCWVSNEWVTLIECE